MNIDISKLSHVQLDDLIRRATERQGELAREKSNELRERFAAMAKAEGLALEDIVGGAARKTRRPVPPKFRNPLDSTQTWSGRGKRPRWFHDALDSGKTADDMLIS